MSKANTIIFLLAFVIVGAAHAQTPTGNIVGIVTDAAGARVSGARISVINRESGLARSFVTSTEGDFSVAALPSGVYKVTAEATGFSPLQAMATVEAGTTTTVNVSLQVGEVTEQVTVDD